MRDKFGTLIRLVLEIMMAERGVVSLRDHCRMCTGDMLQMRVKVKQSRYRSVVAQRVPGS